MGWPLAVSASLMERSRWALLRALVALAGGHFAAMLVILLPFSLMAGLITYQREIRVGAGLVVIGLGLWLLITRRHPRFLARIPPSQLALWSFLVAIAHGAALMLVPIYLGLCGLDEMDGGHRAAADLMTRDAGIAVLVAAAHTAAMLLSGGAIAYAVSRWLGLQFVSRSWFDLEALWALSLIVVGGIGLWSAL
jgi:hypothetical protein